MPHTHTHLLTFVYFLDMNLWADTERLQQTFILPRFTSLLSAAPLSLLSLKYCNGFCHYDSCEVWRTLQLRYLDQFVHFLGHFFSNTHHPEHKHSDSWHSHVAYLCIILLFNKWLFEPVCVSMYHILAQDGATFASTHWCSMMIRHAGSQQVDTRLEVTCITRLSYTLHLHSMIIIWENLCLYLKSRTHFHSH